jgi:prevent-host-death family protein
MKTMTARNAKNHSGEFLDSAQREPVVITRNNRPVGIMLSIQDAADTVFPEMMMDKEPEYDSWVREKVTNTMRRIDSGKTALIEHENAMQRVRARLKARFPNSAA